MVFTDNRAEYGLLKSTITRINKSANLELILVVTGDHIRTDKGETIQEIRNDGLNIAEVILTNLPIDSENLIIAYLAKVVIEFSNVIKKWNPGLLLLLGDRYDLLAPSICALIHRIPIAHIAGGESTEGVLDEQVRHALTKMAHLHFVSTFEYGWRVSQMGEETWRIHVVGAPGVENIHKSDFMTPIEIKESYGINPESPILLITFHPETLTGGLNVGQQIKELITALEHFSEYQQIITYPGTEVGYQAIIKAWEKYASGRANVILKQSLGSRGYLGLMRIASAVVGNSSSGIIETPSFCIPTINIGDRQKGRIRANSVIDVECQKEEIVKGLKKALFDQKFRHNLQNVANPYDPHQDGNVSGRIVSVLESVPLGKSLLEKRLDFPSPEEVNLFRVQ